MSDLIEGLRAFAKEHWFAGIADAAADALEAKDAEIERLQAEIERLQAQIALEQEYSEDLCKKGAELEAEIERLREINSERTASKNWYVIENARLQAVVDAAKTEANKQAEDEGLWFIAKYATEAYLQSRLRRLHAIIESDEKALAALETDNEN